MGKLLPKLVNVDSFIDRVNYRKGTIKEKTSEQNLKLAQRTSSF